MVILSLSPRLFGRRKGRPLHTRKSALMQDLLPRLQIVLSKDKLLNLASLFKGEVWLEVGFGGGEHLAAQAARNPDIGFIGCEPFINGVAGLLDHIDKQQLTNIRIYPDDARVLLDALPDESLGKCFVLYPDPWPKKRHAERRFIGLENLDRLARVMKTNAELWMATDVAALADWMREKTEEHKAFTCLHDGLASPPGWVPTRYEEKGLKAGRQPVYLGFKRNALPSRHEEK
ncbi:MAG: tRNA (guanosine(46)-N7)-methyltransferase TrmB [Alphaproteobacteria bacterium]|nr:tRNA (guanosine(46)-N7)-methyltransferase TrmB [Alphaproteobacteria bacterium]